MAEVKRFRIVDITIIPSAEAGRVGRKDAVVSYQDQAMRMRVTSVPYEEIEGKSEEQQLAVIAAAIKRQEEERMRFIGKEITF